MKLFIAIYLALFIHVTRASFVQNINYGGGRVIDTTKCTGRCTSSIHVIADNAFVGGIKYSDKRKDVLIDHEEVCCGLFGDLPCLASMDFHNENDQHSFFFLVRRLPSTVYCRWMYYVARWKL